MLQSTQRVAVIGAGPYGLAATAHLRAAGVDTRIFGRTMVFWEHQMPAGMLLRSQWEASHIGNLSGPLSLDAYEATLGRSISRPIPLADFVSYGHWYQQQVASDVDERQVTTVAPTGDGYRLTLEDGERVDVRKVVVATGLAQFPVRPPQFAGLPSSLVSHAADHDSLELFRAQNVLIVGGGQSALESAALLHEAGADVELIVRSPGIHWIRRKFDRSYLGPLRRLLYPPSDVGPPGINRLVAAPGLFRRLPVTLQRRFARRAIAPAGAPWLRRRLQGIPISTGRRIVNVTELGAQVSLMLDDGTCRMTNHILLATGYRVNVAGYSFLTPELRSSLAHIDGYPVLGPGFESSSPGLHFLGAPAVESYGPLMRFVAGTPYSARVTSRYIAARSVTRPATRSATPGSAAQTKTSIGRTQSPRAAEDRRVSGAIDAELAAGVDTSNDGR